MNESRGHQKPPDGGYGWVVVFSSFCLFIMGSMPLASFGVFFVEFLSVFETDEQTLSWLGAISQSSTQFFGLLVGVLIEVYSLRVVGIICTLVMSGAFIASSFVTNIHLMFLTFGIIPGIGVNAFYTCSSITVNKYFQKKRSLAMGLTCTGICFGAFAWPPLVTWLSAIFGVRGTMLIIAGLLLNGMVFMALLIQPEDYCFKTNAKNSNETQEHKAEKQEVELTVQHSYAWLAMIKDVFKNTCKKELFLNWRYILYNIVSFGIHLGHMVTYAYLPYKAVSLGIEKSRAAFLVSINGIFGAFMRVLFGWLGDKSFFNRTLMYGLTGCLNGVMSAVSYFFMSYSSLAIYAGIFGTLGGCYVTMINLVPVDIVGIELLAPAIGGRSLFTGGGIILSFALSGKLLSMTGNPGMPFLILGTCQAILSLPILLVTIIDKRNKRAQGPMIISEEGMQSANHKVPKHKNSEVIWTASTASLA